MYYFWRSGISKKIDFLSETGDDELKKCKSKNWFRDYPKIIS